MSVYQHHAAVYAPPEGLTIREILLRVRPPHFEQALDVCLRSSKMCSLDTRVLPGQVYSQRFYEDPHGLGRPVPGVDVHEFSVAVLAYAPETEPDGVDPTFRWLPSKVDS